jgi:hypothetical protein
MAETPAPMDGSSGDSRDRSAPRLEITNKARVQNIDIPTPRQRRGVEWSFEAGCAGHGWPERQRPWTARAVTQETTLPIDSRYPKNRSASLLRLRAVRLKLFPEGKMVLNETNH